MSKQNKHESNNCLPFFCCWFSFSSSKSSLRLACSNVSLVLVRVVVGLEMVVAGVAVLFTILGVFLALGTILDNWSTTEVIPDVIWSNTACFQGATVESSLWHFLKKGKKKSN